MEYLYLSFLFIFLAAACNAVMDILKHKYPRSIFYKKGGDETDESGKPILTKWESFWNPVVSWYASKKVLWGFVAFDAWHSFKFLMLVFLSLSVCFGCYFGSTNDFSTLVAWLTLPAFSITWGVGHTLFYHWVLKKGFWNKDFRV